MTLLEKKRKEVKLINVHQVHGPEDVIDYLRNADFHWVEGLFFHAKRYGKVEFEYQGMNYQLTKNRDLTYTIGQILERASAVESL